MTRGQNCAAIAHLGGRARAPHLGAIAGMGGMSTASKYHFRAAKLLVGLARGECIKRAAFNAEISYRTACRRRRQFMEAGLL